MEAIRAKISGELSIWSLGSFSCSPIGVPAPGKQAETWTPNALCRPNAEEERKTVAALNSRARHPVNPNDEQTKHLDGN
jgi:hypothetical protein